MDLPTIMTGGFSKTNRGLWQLVIDRAACSAGGLPPGDWYPVSVPAAAARREAAAAIAVCERCAVREECLELALRNWTVGQHGVWGGTVPAERQELRAQRDSRPAGVPPRHRDAGPVAR
jgi:WhiB family redox-sensing transcriptional regulator